MYTSNTSGKREDMYIWNKSSVSEKITREASRLKNILPS